MSVSGFLCLMLVLFHPSDLFKRPSYAIRFFAAPASASAERLPFPFDSRTNFRLSFLSSNSWRILTASQRLTGVPDESKCWNVLESPRLTIFTFFLSSGSIVPGTSRSGLLELSTLNSSARESENSFTHNTATQRYMGKY